MRKIRFSLVQLSHTVMHDIEVVGSRVIVLLLSFSSTSCSSPTAVRTCSRTLVTCYQQCRRPLEPVRSTRGRSGCMHFILQT